MASDRTSAAVAAALAVAGRLGARDVRPELLASYTTVVVRLAPLPVVARVAAADGTIPEWFAQELALAGELAARGAPVVAPSDVLPPGPHAQDGLAVSLWRHVAHAGRPAPEAGGTTLRALHEAGRACRLRLTPFDALAESREALASASSQGLLPAPDAAMLERALDRLERAGAPAAVEGDVALHGDSHLGNLLAVPGGPLWCDLEESFRGAVEWDVACLVSRWRIFGEPAARVAADSYGPVERDRLDAIVDLRAVWIACHSPLYAARLGRPSHSLETRLAWLRDRF